MYLFLFGAVGFLDGWHCGQLAQALPFYNKPRGKELVLSKHSLQPGIATCVPDIGSHSILTTALSIR